MDNRTTIGAFSAGNAAANAVAIEAKDIDLQRAEHPSALSHKVFATIAYDLDFDHPTYVGIGGSYEFGDSRKAFDQWAVWAKLGVSF